MKTPLLILTAIGFMSSPGRALLNTPTEGIWTETAEDTLRANHDPSVVGPKPFSLQRLYHSRSLHRGLLGASWCLEFDKTIKIATDGSLTYSTCETDIPITFYLDHERSGVQYYRSSHPDFFNLRKYEEIFTLTDSAKNYWVFNSSGQLLRWKLLGQSERHLTRHSDGRLHSLIWNTTTTIRIHQHSKFGWITALHWHSQSLHYRYHAGQLREVQTPSAHWRYEYDETDNLTSVTKNHQLLRRLTYNLRHDQLVEVRTQDHRLELDALGRLTRITTPENEKIQIQYQASGEVSSILMQNQVVLSADGWALNSSITSNNRTSLESALHVATSSLNPSQNL